MENLIAEPVAQDQRLARTKRMVTGVSIVAFPVLLFLGFVSHPNLFSLSTVADIDSWIAEWRGNFSFHFGHLLVLFAVPFVILAVVRFMSVTQGRGAWLCWAGGILGVFGAFMLAVDKGALTLVLTALQTVPDDSFENIKPALQALFDRAGWLWITWAYVTLPIGVILQAVGMLRDEVIPRWQCYTIIAGLLLLLNPDIEIISSAGAVLMCIGFIPLGLREMAGRL